MGLFNFWKKKDTDTLDEDFNSLLLQAIKIKIEKKGFSTVFSDKYAALIVESEIEIATALVSGKFHQSILPFIALTSNKTYFPEGIQTSLMGQGITKEEKVESACRNYITNIFTPIIDSLKDTHVEEFDFKVESNGREILWHPKMSNNELQGTWQQTSTQINLFSVIEEKVKSKLADKKVNWLKLYISRGLDSKVSGECLLNNEVWEEGYYLLEEYANSWKDKGEFMGQKQFIMFRRCDSYD